ncbi:MAG: IS630 family transposase [Armatimonadota bacterium]|nr:IS630 family transposase [Armatimonadota bacterium]
MAAYKKNAGRLGAHIVFVDESGFQLTPNVRKTWAPKGQTPIHRHHYRREKVSVISGISVSPARKLLGLYFLMYAHNIRHEEVRQFIRHLLKHLRGPVIVVWDNAKIHKGEPIRELCRRHRRLHLEALPPYAPELNPDEGVWGHAKRGLSNGCPIDTPGLMGEVSSALEDIRMSQTNLRGCVSLSGLPLFSP